MERTFFFIFLWTAFEGDTGEHVFVAQPMKWHEAQSYCRQHYTDLSFVHSQRDRDELQKVVRNGEKGWIGLYRDPSDVNAWKWSGGGNITFKNWRRGQPDNHKNSENYTQILSSGQWNDVRDHKMPFYCFSAFTVNITKTWEEALEHCRDRLTNLTSLISETEHLLAKNRTQSVISERAWIGLRYLGGRWLWVNGDPLEYQAWPQIGDQDRQCPLWKRCGALNRTGLWEIWDCQDELSFICK